LSPRHDHEVLDVSARPLSSPLAPTGAGRSVRHRARGRDLDNVSVLVVEDDDDTRELLRLWLEDAGTTVFQARDGGEALRKISHVLPSVILCDLRMPVLDGCSFVRQMHTDLQLRVPVVALTGEADEASLVRTLEAGFSGHMVKPVTRKAVLDQIARVLPQPERRRPIG
jgi:CheY-like chemotaxis protein